MTKSEAVELGLIGFVVLVVYSLSWLFPDQLLLATAVVWLAMVVFLQSLIRDLSMLFYFLKHRGGSSHQPIEKQCFCLESLVGVSVLLIGSLLFFSSKATEVVLNQTVWALSVFAVLITGFLIKDLVITWGPIGIKKEKNHLNIIVKW